MSPIIYGGSRGGGFTPVTCRLLVSSAADVSTTGSHPLLWDGLQDNPWDENTLLAIPAGLGMTFAFNGTASTLTTTVRGTWALSLALLGAATDLTWRGHYDDNLWGQSRFVQQAVADAGQPQALVVGVVMTLPSGAQLDPNIVTDAAAGAQQTMNADLLITRLA